MNTSQKAFVLKVQRYSDADLIVTLLLRDGSRMTAFARAALKSRARFGGGVLEPTHYINATIDDRKTQNQMQTLKEAELVDDFSGLREDYQRLRMAIDITQAVHSASLEGDLDGASIFNLFGHCMRALSQGADSKSVWNLFLAKFLFYHGVLAIDADMAIFLNTKVEDWAQLPKHVLDQSALTTRMEMALQDYTHGLVRG